MAVVSKGFTLLELLVTISIIGILLGIGSVSFSTAQKKGRDSRRQGDMTAIQKALEEYYALTNAYPATVTSGGTIAYLTNTLMNVVPSDPKGGTYVYTYTTDAPAVKTTYCLCAFLDNDGSGNASTVGANGVCAWATGATADYFCVSNQQ
jgi:type IV pilus assembly protein PilE